MNRAWWTLGLVVSSTIVGLMGTDLVLPAVPHLPEALGGDPARAQLVLAAYVGGSCIGLLGFGMLGDRVATPHLFIGSLLATAMLSLACGQAPTIGALIALRVVQGIVASGPAVFAPGIINAMFDEEGAVKAIGVLASIESLAPALAPIAGVALLALGGWQLSFEVMSGLAVVLAVLLAFTAKVPQVSRRRSGSFLALLGDLTFLRYAFSQAFVLGGLLVFVFGMPAVFVRVHGGTLTDFIVMQVCGIATFMVAANLTSRLVARMGAERVIAIGTWLAAAGAFAQFGYAVMGGRSAWVITALFVPVNSGLGLRGPPGFFRAILASHGDDARGSALVMLFVLGVAAMGTALVSPWIERGSIPVAGVALVLHALSVACLSFLPKLPEAGARA
ncbi:MFS transporter [Novosphingobium mangrovi (ex Huang et al. 2023)]|uniref:MFS transporter n=1 Tax=Novosphingobium mangrovi (ex Huang et al. 2023) TaxID=2976432 RepID=A0ABT2I5V1_9SPHN|nr:MFS transporter [Novosphingobium mangrovi (ex Huang et al. 2023)]MCT2400188.1 MFS transporter [Novosphingobium mangrovi (ex Huang et al. 2023)]